MRERRVRLRTAAATFSVPAAFAAMYSASLRADVLPATWTTAAAPSTRGGSVAGSRTSPFTSSTFLSFSHATSSGRAHEGAHAKPGGEECVRDVAADEARAARQRDEVARAHLPTLSQG